MFTLTRRSLIAAALRWRLPDLPPRRWPRTRSSFAFSAVFSDQDIRAGMMQRFAEGIGDGFDYQGYYGGTLFKQGTELVALQRGNLEMGNIAPQDISNQIPEWSALTSAYLFRDADHLRTFFASDVGKEMSQMVEDRLKVKILGPTYFGSRQVGLRVDKKIETPADMAGIKLRMPGGDAWQFLGQALGANPTPMAYAEVLYGPPDRRHRRPGQPAAERPEHEVLRSDVADRPDLASGRLRPADDLARHLECPLARTAGEGAGSRRCGHRLEHRRAHQAGGGACGLLQGAGPADLQAERRCLPHPMRRRCIWNRTWRRTGPRA